MCRYRKLLRLDLCEVACLLRTREITARSVAEACIRQIADSDPLLHAIASHEPEQMLAAADRADAIAADGARDLPPLHGVPLGHKDMFYRRGRVSECGSRVRAGFKPGVTATVLRRLDEAGALDIARLNMAEFAIGATGHNDYSGTPRNPHSPDRVPGGSSSGSAVAVASGMVFGALGSDTGGSIRQPAAFCGVVGLKPTPGRVSRAGVMALSPTLDIAGPIARSARDAALLFSIIAGEDRLDPLTADQPPFNFEPAPGNDLRGVRIAVPEDYFNDALDTDVAAALDVALVVLRGLGATTVPVSLPMCEEASRAASLICSVEAADQHRDDLNRHPALYGPQTRARLLAGRGADRAAYTEALARREPLRRAFEKAVFTSADMLFAPTMPMTAPLIAESDVGASENFMEYVLRFGRCTRPFSYLGLPALSVPAAPAGEGLPAAFQLVGPAFTEARLLRTADAYEREAGTGWRRRVVGRATGVDFPGAGNNSEQAA